MKKKVFDRLVERELKKFKNYVMSDFMTKFIMDLNSAALFFAIYFYILT